MKGNKIIYWIATLLFSSVMLFSAVNYFTNPSFGAYFKHLGFPDYFRAQLGVAKIIGVLIILIPGIPKLFKNFAYAGFVICTLSASIAHFCVKDDIATCITPLAFLVFILISFFFSKSSNTKLVD
jgi:hypothetical protein